jgi:glycine cleavage system H protein
MFDKLRYTKEHYCLQMLDNDLVAVGLTDYLLSDMIEYINTIEFPDIGAIFNRSDRVGAIVFEDNEMELYAPVGGEVSEINEDLSIEPNTLRNSTFDNSWIYRMYVADIEELSDTMSEEEYNEYLETL